MFRWPLAISPLSFGGGGVARTATIEVTPRGAIFTLAALAHVGHPAHLALIDAYIKGQIRLSVYSTLGDDSRVVLASLAAPLVAADALGIERLSLADLVLLRTPFRRENVADGEPFVSPGCPRLLLRAPSGWQRVRASESLGPTGCLGTPHPGLGSALHDVAIEAPARPRADTWATPGSTLDPIVAEVREATDRRPASEGEVRRARAASLLRFARLHESPSQSIGMLELAEAIQRQAPFEGRLSVAGRHVTASLRLDWDSYQSLCLLPPADADPTTQVEPMRDVAWETLEGLIGRPLPEHRTEPIALRLLADDGRTTTLDVGASVVLGRNQTAFTCWVGSDGRVMLKLFPPGGMAAR